MTTTTATLGRFTIEQTAPTLFRVSTKRHGRIDVKHVSTTLGWPTCLCGPYRAENDCPHARAVDRFIRTAQQ